MFVTPRTTLAYALALASVLPANHSYADAPRTGSLAWIRGEGAASCATSRELARGIEARIGRSVFVSPTNAELVIEGHIDHKSTGFKVHFEALDAAGQSLGVRDIESDDDNCAAFTESITLVASLLIDPEAVLRTQAAEAPAPQPSPPPAPVDTVVPPLPPASVIEAAHWIGTASLSAIGSLGSLPHADAGGLLRAEFTPPHFIPIFLGAALFAPSNETIASIVRANYTLSYGEFGACPLDVVFGPVSLEACAGLVIGSLNAYATQITSGAKLESNFLVNGLVEARVRIPAKSRVAAVLDAGMQVPFRRYSFDVLGDRPATTPAFQMSVLSGYVDLGVAVTFF